MQPITLTESALNKVQQELQQGNMSSKTVRVSIQKSGCTGYKYVITYGDPPEEDDQRYALPGDIQLLIKNEELLYIMGMTVDYAREGINKRFRFTNPNEKANCGCGESVRFD